jgi:hypothetical protein
MKRQDTLSRIWGVTPAMIAACDAAAAERSVICSAIRLQAWRQPRRDLRRHATHEAVEKRSLRSWKLVRCSGSRGLVSTVKIGQSQATPSNFGCRASQGSGRDLAQSRNHRPAQRTAASACPMRGRPVRSTPAFERRCHTSVATFFNGLDCSTEVSTTSTKPAIRGPAHHRPQS